MSDDLAIYSATNPIAVLTSEQAYSEFLQRIKEEVSGHTADVSTEKGRDAVRSLAYKVTRTKTAIDNAGKKLNEDSRRLIDAVDAQRRKIRAEFDALASEVRKPLTEWEAAEEKRNEAAAVVTARIAYLAGIPAIESSMAISATILELEALEIDADVHREMFPVVIKSKQDALARLSDYLAAANERERIAAELERMQRAEAERLAREEAARLERERIESERIAAEAEAERQRIAEYERVEREDRIRREREEAARVAADQAREEAITAERRKADEEIAAAEAKAREAQELLERQAAEARAARETAEAELAEANRRREAEAAEVERVRKEDERRAADRMHRSVIMKAAKEAMMAHAKVSEDQAKAIVLAIVAGEIPNVRMAF